MSNMKTLAFVGTVAALATVVDAEAVYANTDLFNVKPDCNSKVQIATYLGQETYYAKHPYDGSGTTPAYGEWFVPCNPDKVDLTTGQPFPADYIKCAPNHLVRSLKTSYIWNTNKTGRGQDRFIVCVQAEACKNPKIPSESEGAVKVKSAGPDLEPSSIHEIIQHFQDRVSLGPEATQDDLVLAKAEVGEYLTQVFAEFSAADSAAEGQGAEAELQYSSDFEAEEKAWNDWYFGADRQMFQQYCGTRYFAFSGSDDMTDWVADFSAKKGKAYGTEWHNGFLGKYEDHSFIDTDFWSVGDHHIFAGHSLGGGIAQIAATHLKYVHPSASLEYITHGSGAAAWAGASNRWNTVWGKIQHTNLFNMHIGCWPYMKFTKQDLVPSLTKLAGFEILQHAGWLNVINDNFEKIGWTGLCNRKRDTLYTATLQRDGVDGNIHRGGVYYKRITELGL